MKHILSFLVVSALVLLATILSQSDVSAQATVLTVNSAKDNVNAAGCDAAHCTLREAILQSNSTVGSKEYIHFNINRFSDLIRCNLQTKVCTIQVNTPLPTITDPVLIEGYYQPGASHNSSDVWLNTQIKIALDGKDRTFDGLVVEAEDTHISGLALTDFRNAIVLDGDNNSVWGNFIGMKPDGENAIPNRTGVNVKSGLGNRIGGEAKFERNLISGNERDGIVIANSHGALAQGNYIGSDRSGLKTSGGTANPGNGATGITITDSNAFTIGGASEGARNIIVGNTSWGIQLSHSARVLGIIEGNYIGVGADGKFVMGNQIGIGMVGEFVDDVKINRNLIANNKSIGVQILFDTTHDIVLSENRIYSNAKLGIDFGGDDVTPNDNNDVDEGPNHLQNFPVLTKVKPSVIGTTIKGKMNGVAFTSYRIEFYLNQFCDPTGYGEGKTFIFSEIVKTDITGNVKFAAQTGKILQAPGAVTATATRLDGSENPIETSEFSMCRAIE